MIAARQRCFLLVIDVQAKLAPAIRRDQTIRANTIRLIEAARKLHIPIRLTEHCPERIGHTVPEIRNLAQPTEILTKLHFSAQAEPACARAFGELNRDTPIICGMETHVCVMQTALELHTSGHHPFIIADAVGSRKNIDRNLALNRMAQEGLRITTTETILFEWLQRGDTREFREILPLIKTIPDWEED